MILTLLLLAASSLVTLYEIRLAKTEENGNRRILGRRLGQATIAAAILAASASLYERYTLLDKESEKEQQLLKERHVQDSVNTLRFETNLAQLEGVLERIDTLRNDVARAGNEQMMELAEGIDQTLYLHDMLLGFYNDWYYDTEAMRLTMDSLTDVTASIFLESRRLLDEIKSMAHPIGGIDVSYAWALPADLLPRQLLDSLELVENDIATNRYGMFVFSDWIVSSPKIRCVG